MAGADLQLRDVHLPLPPSWWPPAPGWWLLAGAVVLVLAGVLFWLIRRRTRLRGWQVVFDRECAEAADGGERVAAISALLRRAARRVDARADVLQGEQWLRFLDGSKGHAFSAGDGCLLLDGGFRREVDARALAHMQALARMRFLELMRGRR